MTPAKIEFPKDGKLCWGTKVFTSSPDGAWVELPFVSRIQMTIEPDSMLKATIDLAVAPEAMHCHVILSEESLAAAAAHYGMKLVPIDG